MKKIKTIKRISKYLLFIIVMFISINGVKADYQSDHNSTISTSGGGNCNSSYCWNFPDNQSYVSGIRVSVVNSNGDMVSKRTMDYLNSGNHAYRFNTNRGYSRCYDNARNKITYLKYNAPAKWGNHNGEEIAKYLDMPDIFRNRNSAQIIKDAMNNGLDKVFFDDIGYTLPNSVEERNEHYIIIEPVTAIISGGRQYYGTYYELASSLPTGSGISTSSVLLESLPLSMYISGNNRIKGSARFENGTYFKGLLREARWPEMRNPYYTSQLGKQYRDQHFGWGVAIYWLGVGSVDEPPDLDITPPIPPKCDFNNSSHFRSTTSGPNNEDCCIYVLDNLKDYNITKEDLFNRHRRCRQNIINTCKFGYDTSQPSCNTSAYGYIKDIDDWVCIKSSPLSNNSTFKNYFLKYGNFDSACSVYCRDEIKYLYPGSGMIALAGNYFTIANKSNSYSYYIDDVTKTTKVKAATLGPITITVKRECTIDTDPDTVTSSDLNQCQVKLNDQLDQLKAPAIEFAYESDYYNNPTENLRVSKTTTTNSNDNNIKSRTIKYEYSLPTTTYYSVSKGNGESTKYKPSSNNSNYITIGYHLPIHFTQATGRTEYQIGIKNFNNQNFNNAFINGNKMPTTIKSSIESYIQNLRKSGKANASNINGRWYLDKTFVKLLEKANYDKVNFMQMSCANTSSYTCNYDDNGIYCLDKNSNSNSEQTYKNLDSCIRTEVQKLKTNNVSYKSDLTYTCNFTVRNTIGSTPDPDPSGYKCKYINGKYYGINGNIVSKDTYTSECGSSPINPDNPSCIPGDPDCPGNNDEDDNCVGPSCNPGGIDPEDGPGGINVIFRPISLDNPFPSIDGDGRKTGSNWCYWYDCANTNDVVKKAITNNRNVTTEKVYKDLGPLYKITLTPATIKEIRAYNKKTTYDDFNLKCNNGTKCLSDFIRKNFISKFTGCGIKGHEGTTKCQDFDRWG